MGGIASAIGGIAGTVLGGPLGGQIGGAVGGLIDSSDQSSDQSSAVQGAANQADQANIYAANLQKQMFDKQLELQEPWRQAGVTALNALTPLATNYQKFGMSQFQQDPGYAFRLSQGQKALDQAAAARGGLISGNALKAAQRYGQEMGSQEYQNAFNRYQTERNAQLNPLQSLAGVGQSSANTIGNASANYANTAGQMALNNAGIQGNALLTQANVRGSQYGGLGNAVGRVNWNNLYSPGGGYTYGGSYESNLPDNIDVGGGWSPAW